MKLFTSKIFTLGLSLLTTLLLSVSTQAQSKENKNFKAGVAALDAQNMPVAFKEFLTAAKAGHIDSQYNVGVMYEKGIGTIKNEKEALTWYNKASEKGHSGSQYNLGVLYENGKGTAVNYTLANKWYRKASVQGDAWAIGNLGMLYLKAQGVKENKVAGMALLLLSVQLDNSPENTAKKNISNVKGLTQQMVGDAQKLAAKMTNTQKMMTPLDEYLKKSNSLQNKKI